MIKKLKIELKSNLCASSGSNLGSLVDTDICYDEYGLVYIPSKRIKGLLKEACLEYFELTQDNNILSISNKLFGYSANNNPGDLIIDNAYLQDIDIIRNDLDNILDTNCYLSRQRIINTYTNICFQTRVNKETQVAEEGTLRTKRVIEKGNCFYANIEFSNEEEFELLKKLVKLVTHMGLSRTRGFGEVSLSLSDIEIDNIENNITLDDNKEYKIELLLKSDSAIMVSKNNSLITEEYIPGSNIMGSIAYKYIKDNNIDLDNIDSNYINLFLDGSVKYSNAYITDKDGKYSFYKAPLSFCKKKDEEIYYNKMIDITKDIQTSSLNNKYVTLDYDKNYITSVKTSQHLHHQRPKDKKIGKALGKENGEDGTFFQFVSIDMNQYFKSNIIGLGKYLKQIIKYLNMNNTLRVGKSKTAEYGKLVIKNIKVDENNNNKREYKHFALILTSPLIIYNKDKLNYANSKEELINYLKNELNINHQYEKAFIGYGVESGYNALWNLPKEQLPSYQIGTTIVFNLDDKLELKDNYTLGLRTNEGYGCIKVYDLDNKEELVLNNLNNNKTNIKYNDLLLPTKNILKQTLKQVIKEEMLQDSLNTFSSKNKNSINNSTIGRLLLMVEEIASWDGIVKNINDIAQDAKKEQVLRYIKYIDKNINNLNSIKYYQELFDLNDIDKLKLDYLKQILLVLKIGGKND